MDLPNISLIIPSNIDNIKVHLKYMKTLAVILLLVAFSHFTIMPACNWLGTIYIKLQLDCTVHCNFISITHRQCNFVYD